MQRNMIDSLAAPQIDIFGIIIKAFIFIGLIIYLILAVFLYFRIRILAKTLHTEHSDRVLYASFIHMVAVAILTLLLSFVLLV